MASFDFDLFVIGAGSGGVRAARTAATMGQRVAIAEEKYLGGTCVNVGCVPKKLLVYASHYAEDFSDAQGFGWALTGISHDWGKMIANKNKEINRLNGIYDKLLKRSGVSLFNGRATITGPQTVSIEGSTVHAAKILICTGGYPSLPDIEGKELAITSDEVFYLPEKPDRVAIVGGGYIACEFAGIFNQFGIRTDLIYRGKQLLRHFDHGISTFVANEMQKKGIHIHYETAICSMQESQQGINCLLSNETTLTVDKVLYATGRHPNTRSLGLESTSVNLTESGHINVNDRFQTDEPSIFALGDVIGTPELTPVALAQAMVFVDQQFGKNQKTMNYAAIPTAIFSQPNYATVGLTEEQIEDKGIQAEVFISEFKYLKHSLSGNDERVMMKIIVDKKTDIILGMHMAGPEAGEIIQGFAVAVKAGLTKKDLDMTIGIHPTLAEEFVTMRESRYSL